MAFIEKKDPVVVNIKLTSCGRELLSSGNLNFSSFAIGDSEIDYKFNSEVKAKYTELGICPSYSPYYSNILQPADVNPSIISFIPKNVSGTVYNILPSIPTSSYIVTNPVSPIGFFTQTTGTTFTFNTDPNLVKQPYAMVHMSGVTGGRTINLRQTPSKPFNGNEPAIGDLLLIKWTLNEDTTSEVTYKTKPTPFLIYKISGKTGTLSANNLVVTVDRNIPNFTGYAPTGKAGAMIYQTKINVSGDSLQFSTQYLDESVISFLTNSQCGTAIFPFWDMTIIYTDNIAGISASGRTFAQYSGVTYGGFVSYIQNQAPILKKLGVIHYSNASPANVYGEGFYLKTPVLDIPTIMWHKSSSKTLGVKLTAYGNSKLLTGTTKSLNLEYYNLADPNGNIVGKIFTDLKIFVIEDEELLFAMSYKSNRSWTMPDFILTLGGGDCVA